HAGPGADPGGRMQARALLHHGLWRHVHALDRLEARQPVTAAQQIQDGLPVALRRAHVGPASLVDHVTVDAPAALDERHMPLAVDAGGSLGRKHVEDARLEEMDAREEEKPPYSFPSLTGDAQHLAAVVDLHR